MKENKLETIIKLFENKEIRSLWDASKEKYFFSVVDVIKVLTDSPRPRKYWNALKTKLSTEGSELSQKVGQLKMKARDGKIRKTDTLDMEGLFRLIEAVPSPKAEPFKLWLARLGKERVDEVFDPEIVVNRAVEYYRYRGYSDKWIKARLGGIIDRKRLTDVWKEGGIKKDYEYAILTNEIYKTWSGMTAQEYKKYKNIRKENLRDNMTRVEIALTDLGEIATEELTKKQKPYGFLANKRIAKSGGDVAKTARINLEEKLGETIISKDNDLNYQYIEDHQRIINKEDN